MNIKLFSVALAVAALASCSNDEFSSNSASGPITKTMNVTVEDVQSEDGGTRAAYYATSSAKNAFRFLEGDQINVYDNNLAAYDEFTLGADSKWATTTSNVKEHKFGVYPATRWENHGWTPGGLRASVMIPRAWNAAGTIVQTSYSTAKESVTVGTNTYDGYTSNVPVWGATTDDPTNVLNMDMKYLTGILKISLSKVSDASARWIKVTSAPTDAPISGYFYAILKAGTTPELTVVNDNEALQNYYAKGHDIIISLPGGTTAYDYCVYVPIISGVEFSNLTVSYGSALTNDVTTAAWTTIYTYTNKTFKRGTIYSSGLSARFYSDDSMEPQNVSDAAAVAANSNLDIILKAGQLNVAANANQAGKHTIDLPATDKNVTLDFAAIKGTSGTLTIQGANFTGDFTLKNGVASQVPVKINLPKANKVTLAGVYASTTADALTITEAKTLVFGDGSMITTANAANLTLTKVTEGIEVANDATVSGTLNITGTNVQVPVTIGGSMANLTTKSDVTVNTVKEAIAISGKLLLTGNANITLKQGLINEIETAEAVDATLINPEGQGVAAIKTYTDNTSGTLTTQGISKWNGVKISAANLANYKTGATGEIWTASQFASFAGTPIGTAANLKADIDLNNDVNYIAPVLTTTFNGGNHTIYNIGWATATAGLFASTGAASIKVNDLTLDGVTVTGATLNTVGALFNQSGYANLQVNNVSVKNATLGGADVAGAYNYTKIGGFIGEVRAATTFTDCKVSGEISGYQMLGGFVGCIGTLSGVRLIKFAGVCESDVAFTFAKTYTTAADAAFYVKSNVKNANIIQDPYTTAYPATLIGTGTIGTYVGAVFDANDYAQVEIGLKCTAKNALDKEALGFNNNWFEEETATKGVYIQEFFHGVTDYIGYSPAFKSITFWKDRKSQTYTTATKKAFNAYSQTAN